MKHYSLFLGALIASCFLFSCTQKEEEVAVSSVNVSQPTAEMIVGETVKLSATITPSNATNKDIVWASSKQSVATVDRSGLVTAIAEGTSNITASAGGKIGTCVVMVSKRVIVVSSIELNKTNLDLVEEEEFTLVATVKPDDATDKTVSWSSSDPSVATVAEGKVKALKEGTATITAKAGEKSTTCSLTVEKKVIAVESVSLNKETLELTKGQSETLIATVKPDDATDKTVIWTTDSENIAVNQEGLVTAFALGTAVITVTTTDGAHSAKCEVSVSTPIPDAIDLGLSVKWASFNIGASTPEDYGDYYAWGETEPKSEYSWETYKWCNGTSNTLTKYNCRSSFGSIDNKTVLDAEDDVAHVKLGGNWRMPTNKETSELSNTWDKSDYRWEWTTINGHKGWLVTYLVNNNSIFLPAAGFRSGTKHLSKNSYGDYSSSSLTSTMDNHFSYFSFSADGVYDSAGYRYWGLPIRPVTN